jgi:hypothetical protein
MSEYCFSFFFFCWVGDPQWALCSEQHLPSVISSPSLQNGGFTEVNRQFTVSGTYRYMDIRHSRIAVDKSLPALLAFCLFLYGMFCPHSDMLFSLAYVYCSYISALVMILSNYGYFASSFTQQTCQHYYLAAPVFKGLSSRCSPTKTMLTML